MPLFLLEAIENWDISCDVAMGFVVRAKNEDQARIFASEQRGDEGSAAWLDPARTSCAVLTARGAPGVIIRDYYGT
jgi:hypothetical protein